MDPALYLCLTLLLALLPNSVAAKKRKGGGGGGGGGKIGGRKSSGSSPTPVFVPASGGSPAYCRDRLTCVDFLQLVR